MLHEFDKAARLNPCLTIALPSGVIETSKYWRTRLGNAVDKTDDKSRIADTLTGCEVLAWFIDRFSIYGAGRAVPAKLLLHQILDIIDEICRLQSGQSKFETALKSCFSGEVNKDFCQEVLDLWITRHRSHLSASRNMRDHGYNYFPCIDRAWKCTIDVIDRLGGNCSDYSGILSNLNFREEQRRLNREAQLESL